MFGHNMVVFTKLQFMNTVARWRLSNVMNCCISLAQNHRTQPWKWLQDMDRPPTGGAGQLTESERCFGKIFNDIMRSAKIFSFIIMKLWWVKLE